MQPLQLRSTTYVLLAGILLLAVVPAAAETVRSGFIEIDTSEIGAPPQGTKPAQSLIEYLGNAGFETGSLPPWGYSGGGPGPDETWLDDVSIQVVGTTEINDATWGQIKSLFE
jgi:hypothetical protein